MIPERRLGEVVQGATCTGQAGSSVRRIRTYGRQDGDSGTYWVGSDVAEVKMLIMIVMRWPCSSRYFGNLPMSVMRACTLQQTKAGYHYVATETCC